jgi:hypothetical protein
MYFKARLVSGRVQITEQVDHVCALPPYYQIKFRFYAFTVSRQIPRIARLSNEFETIVAETRVPLAARN